jgi:hypothetical protein
MKIASSTAACALLLMASTVHAENANGVVTGLGCHNVDDVCWVSLDGYGNSVYCNHTNQLRWDASTSWGKRWYATILAASLSGRSLWFYVSPDTCSAQGYPTFVYGGM